MSRIEYAQRMNRVLDYLDAHLAEPLDLDRLADVTNFSRFHFHRVFAAWLGETVGSYVRRRRLEVAAMRLDADPGLAILEVAVLVGFGSAEAFARAFKDQFRLPPSVWRDQAPARRQAWLAQLASQRAQLRNGDQIDGNGDQVSTGVAGQNGDSHHPVQRFAMQVNVTHFSPVRNAYSRHHGPYGPTIGNFWREQFLPWAAANDLGDRVCYRIGHDDPSLTAAEKCRYDACCEVPDGFTGGAKANLTTLPGGRYAVAQFKGSSANIGEAWSELFRIWLPTSGYVCDERPCFERYLDKRVTTQ